ncbi:MAG TPA: HAMP domain-containing sensor histidine kinase, partial [Chthoniobacterales bacterium]
TKPLTEKIISNIDRADSMIADLLDANRIKAGERLPLKTSVCDIDAVVSKTVDELRQPIGSRLRLETSGPCVGQWSETVIRRVLENLVSNAAKYGSRDGPITVRLQCQGDGARIQVHNLGSQLSDIEAASLFKIFHRSKQAEAGEHRGWGIGLALVKGLAEAHGGTVSVESSAGKGTCFTVELKEDHRPPDDTA